MGGLGINGIFGVFFPRRILAGRERQSEIRGRPEIDFSRHLFTPRDNPGMIRGTGKYSAASASIVGNFPPFLGFFKEREGEEGTKGSEQELGQAGEGRKGTEKGQRKAGKGNFIRDEGWKSGRERRRELPEGSFRSAKADSPSPSGAGGAGGAKTPISGKIRP